MLVDVAKVAPDGVALLGKVPIRKAPAGLDVEICGAAAVEPPTMKTSASEPIPDSLYWPLPEAALASEGVVVTKSGAPPAQAKVI